MKVEQIIDTLNFIDKRADEIYNYSSEKEFGYLSFDAYELLNYDYFYLYNSDKDACIVFLQDESECNYRKQIYVPIKLFESDNWKELMAKDNELGEIKSIEENTKRQKFIEKKEYEEYMKLKEKFENTK